MSPQPSKLDGLRIAVSADLGHAAVSPCVRRAFLAAVDTLADLGAGIEHRHPDLDPKLLERTLKPIAFTEQAAAAANKSEADLARSEADYRRMIAQGRSYSGTDYIEATYRRASLRAAFLTLFQKVDAFVTPAVAVTAFEAGALGVDSIDTIAVDRHLGWSPFSWPINLAGLPAATIPCGFDADGLPIGLQIVAPMARRGDSLPDRRGLRSGKTVGQDLAVRRPSASVVETWKAVLLLERQIGAKQQLVF